MIETNLDRLSRDLASAIKSIPHSEKVAEMQHQIDEDFRFKQYLMQRLKGEHATTMGFDNMMSNMVISLLDEKLKDDE